VSGSAGYTQPTSAYGVYGSSAGAAASDGVHGTTTGGAGSSGVAGLNTGTGGHGVYGSSNSGWGVYGTDSASGPGVYGLSSSGYGVKGVSTSGDGIYGAGGTSGDGVHGTTGNASGSGVTGVNTSNGLSAHAVYGTMNTAGEGTAIYGENNSSAANAWAGYFNGYVYTTQSYSSSDARLKHDIKTLDGGLEHLLQLRGVTFEWNDTARGKGTQTGFIAQEVEKVFPEWITTDLDGFKAVNTRGVDALLVESVRALKMKNDALEARLRVLEENRRPLISGLTAEGMLFGLGLVAMGGGFMISRRKRSESDGKA
jgi:hypothetical protein